MTRKHVEIVCDLLDNVAADRGLAVRISGEHRVVAKVINVSRNSFRALEDQVDRTRREDIRVLRTGDHQTLGDVTLYLSDIRERMHIAAKRDTLLELAEVCLVQLVLELLLSREH